MTALTRPWASSRLLVTASVRAHLVAPNATRFCCWHRLATTIPRPPLLPLDPFGASFSCCCSGFLAGRGCCCCCGGWRRIQLGLKQDERKVPRSKEKALCLSVDAKGEGNGELARVDAGRAAGKAGIAAAAAASVAVAACEEEEEEEEVAAGTMRPEARMVPSSMERWPRAKESPRKRSPMRSSDSLSVAQVRLSMGLEVSTSRWIDGDTVRIRLLPCDCTTSTPKATLKLNSCAPQQLVPTTTTLSPSMATEENCGGVMPMVICALATDLGICGTRYLVGELASKCASTGVMKQHVIRQTSNGTLTCR